MQLYLSAHIFKLLCAISLGRNKPIMTPNYSCVCWTDSMESPEVPVFSTLEIKMNKQLGQSCSDGGSDPKSPSRPSAATATPELPTFETPYISKLISAKKVCAVDLKI